MHTEVETRKARKQHRCSSCGEVIEPGQAYMVWTSFGDTATTNKMHPECYEAHDKLASQLGETEWEFSRYGHVRGCAD